MGLLANENKKVAYFRIKKNCQTNNKANRGMEVFKSDNSKSTSVYTLTLRAFAAATSGATTIALLLAILVTFPLLRKITKPYAYNCCA